MSVSDPGYRQDGRRQQAARTSGDQALSGLSNRLAEARRAGDPAPEELERLVALLAQSGYEPGERLTSALEGLARWTGEAAEPAYEPAPYPQDQARKPAAAAPRQPVPAELEHRLVDFAKSLGERPKPSTPTRAAPEREPQAEAAAARTPPTTDAPERKPQAEAAAAQTPPIASLRNALAEIAARQKALDAERETTQSGPAPHMQAPVRQDHPRQDYPRQDYPRQDDPRQDDPRQDHPRQDRPGRDASRFQSSRPAPARPDSDGRAPAQDVVSAGVMRQLHAEIDRLGHAVGDLPTRVEIDGLVREMSELAGRLGADRPARLDRDSLVAIDSLVAEVDRMRGEAASPKVIVELAEELHTISARLDELGPKSYGAIEALSRRIDSVRLELDQFPRAAAVDGMAAEIQLLIGRLDAQEHAVQPTRDAVVGLSGRVAALDGKIDSIAQATIARDDALERINAAIRAELEDMPRAGAVNNLGRQIDALTEGLNSRSAIGPALKAVEGLSGRVEALDGKIDAMAHRRGGEIEWFAEAVRDELAAVARPDALDQLSRQIDALTADVAAQRPEPIVGVIELLSDRIEGLGGRMESVAAATRCRDAAFRQVEALAASLADRDGPMSVSIVDAINRRIDGLGQHIEAAASEARERAGAFDRIEAMTAKLVAKRPEPVSGAIEALSGKIDGLGDRMETAADAARARAVIMEQIEALTANLAARQAEPAAEVVGALTGRIDTLGDRMEAMTAATRARGLSFERIEESVRAIAEQLVASRSGSEAESASALEAEVARVIDTLDRNDERIDDLHAAFAGLALRIERSCADLGAHCVESAVSAARNALEAEPAGGGADEEIAHALDRLRASAAQSERRAADTLEAVRSTLDRLLEKVEDRTSAAPQPVPALDPARPEPRIAPAEPAPDATEAARAAARRALEEIGSAERVPFALMPRVESAAFERYADFAPDHPIEPGAVQPRIEPGAAQTAAAFIAAARRNAVQIAADDELSPSGAGLAAEELDQGSASSSRLSGMIAALKSRGRPLALGAVAILIVCAALYVASGMTGQQEEAPPEPTGQSEIAPAPESEMGGAGSAPAAAPAQAEPSPKQEDPRPAAEAPPPPPAVAPKAEAAPVAPKAEAAPVGPKAEAAPVGPKAEAAPVAPKVEADSVAPKAEAAPVAPDALKSTAQADVDAATSTAAIAPRAPAQDLTGFAFADAGQPRAEWKVGEPVTTGSIAKSAGELPDQIGGPTLRIRAVSGDPSAQLEIADRLLEGRNVEADPAAAATWLEKAAAQGLAPAQHRLGSLYEKGRGVTRDIQGARRWYERAAASGNVRAMHNLGVVHAEGGLGKPDFNAAVVWFRMSAERGLVDSQYNLAVLCARGLGGKRDMVEAYKWFALAAQQGDQDAASKRDDVAKSLGGSLGAAKTAVEQFTPRNVDAAANDVPTPAGGWDHVADKKDGRPR